MNTTSITPDVWYLDLEYLGVPHLIATGVLETNEGLLLVDPGPTTALDTLRETLNAEGVGMNDLCAVLLTHIHLDHAGATGTIISEAPEVQVYVHRRGARHLIDPSRLLRSARRIYGDAMERLWGTVRAVPEENVQILDGGETIHPGSRPLEGVHTPGHATHHVSYLDTATGTAFIGDVGGMRIVGADYVLPVAPPPDIDLDRWHTSIDAVRNWEPERIVVTHFGAFEDVQRHLDEMEARLDQFGADVRAMMGRSEDDRTLAEQFQQAEIAAMKEETPEPLQPPYEHFGRPSESWHGLARYWRRRER